MRMISVMSRRLALAVGGAAALLLAGLAAPASAQVSEDGLFVQEWIPRGEDLPAQLEQARRDGKHLVLLWETPNCERCALFHQERLDDPDLVEHIRDSALVVQLNRLGARPVIGFDGETTTESALAASFAMAGAPTLQILRQEIGEGDIKESEVMRQHGYQPPEIVRAMFDYVAERGYEEKFFAQWYRDRQ